MKKTIPIVFSFVLASTGSILVPFNVSAMELANRESHVMAVSEATNLAALNAMTDEVSLSDWALPDAYEISDTLINQTGISYMGVNTEDPTQLHLKMAYRATATPASIDWIYLRLDPDLAPYIDEINIKNTVNIGAQVGYLRYFERVDQDSLANVNTWGNQTGNPDVYAKISQKEGAIYRVLLDKFFTRIPGTTPKKRGALSGNWGVFPSVPLEAERYEANIYIKLKEPVSEIQEKLGRKYFGVQLRLQGQTNEGKAIIAEESINKNSVINLEQKESSENNSNWLNSPSVHKITSTFEGKQMGEDGEFSNVLSNTNKSLLRVQNSVLNNLLYGTATDLRRPVSFYVEIDPQILKLVSDEDYITIWQVYRESHISHHDGGRDNPPIMLKKDMFVNNRIKIEVNKEKAGTYDNGTYYVNAVERFVNTVSSSPFVGANFIDIPIMAKPLYEDKNQLVSASIRTWFTDVKDGEERTVRNSLACSYLSLFPSEINFYDYETKDSEHPTKIRDTTYLVSTFGQKLDGNEIGNLATIDNYEYITSEPEAFVITEKNGNVLNLYYRRLNTYAEINTPTIEEEKVELGSPIDLTDNVSNLSQLPKGTTVKDVTREGTVDTNTPGEYEGTIEIQYPDGSKDIETVSVKVVDKRTDAQKYTPTIEEEKVELGSPIDLTDNVSNLSQLPKGTTVKDVTREGTIDTNTPGEYKGTIEIQYPDGSKDTETVSVKVVDKRTDVQKYTPTIEEEKVELGSPIDLTDNVSNLSQLPKGTTVKDVTREGTIDTNTPGEYKGTIEIQYPDGSKDTETVSVKVVDKRTDAQKYTPTIEEEKVELGSPIDLTDNVSNLTRLPKGTTVKDVTREGSVDTNTPGEYEGTIEIQYPDGSKDTATVSIKVVDNRTDAQKYTPTIEEEKVELGSPYDLTDNVSNLSQLPKGTTVKDVTREGTIDTNTPGEYEGTIEIQYPDGSKDTETVSVKVVDKRTDAQKYTPTIEEEKVELGNPIDLTDNVSNLSQLPKGTTVKDVTREGTVDTNTPGEYEGTIEIQYPDGSKDTATVSVKVVDNRTDAQKYTPTIEGEEIELGSPYDLTDNVSNLTRLPKGTTVKDITREGTVDTNTPGEYEGTIEIQYPDGSKDTETVSVKVVDKRTDAQKYTPTIEEEKVELGSPIDLTDNVSNLTRLPKGTTVKDITREGTVDTNTPGEYEGTIEIQYPDGSKDTATVSIKVVDNRTDAQKYILDDDQIVPEIINKGDESDLTDNIVGLPEGSSVEVVTPINPDQVGNQTGVVKVVFPDGSSTTVEIPATIKDRVEWTEIQPIPTIEVSQIVPEIINKGDESDLTDNIVGLPEGSSVEVVTPINPDQVGNQTGIVKVVFPDGSSTTVEIPVTVKDRVEWTEIQPIPTIEVSQIVPEIINKGDESDLTDNIVGLPEGSSVKVVTPINPDQVGNQTGVVKVVFPDGSSTTVEIPAIIKDRVEWTEIQPIPTIEGSQIVPEIINKGDESDLTDNIVGLPEGSSVEVVTPINPDQVGNQTGVVKVVFPDGSSTTVEIPATIKDRVEWTEIQPIPTIEDSQIVPEIINKGDETDLTDNIVGLPEGSSVEVVTPINPDQVGNQTGVVKVVFPNGSSTTVEIPAIIKDRVEWTEIQPIPTIEDNQIVPEIINKGDESDLTDNIVGLPEGSNVEVVTSINPDQIGNQTGVVKVVFPDGSSTTVEIPATVKERIKIQSVPAPVIEGEEVELGSPIVLADNVTNLSELPEGTTVTDTTREGSIDTDTPGEYEGTIEIKYPNGSKDTLTVPVKVVNLINPNQTGDKTGKPKEIFSDNSSATVEISATAKKSKSEIEKNKIQNPSSNKEQSAKSNTVPKTGDRTKAGMFSLLLTTSGGILLGLFKKKKRTLPRNDK